MLATTHRDLIATLTKKAQDSSRKRVNYNFHEPQDRVQRMVNVLIRGTYVPPHVHENPQKDEHFVIVSGEVAVVSFENDGSIAAWVLLEEDGQHISCDIPAGTYHMLVCLSEVAVLMEFIEGPYDPKTHKKMAEFAPAEQELKADEYLETIYEHIEQLQNT